MPCLEGWDATIFQDRGGLGQLNALTGMDQIITILRREIKIKISYRMTLVTSSVSAVAGLLAYGLLGNSSVVSVTTTEYGMSLASYLVSGVAFAPLITNGLAMFGNYIYPSQLEAVMTMPTSFRRYLLLSSILPIVTSIGSALLSFTAGVFMFGLVFSYNFPALATLIALGLATSIALGFLGVAFQLVYKQTAVLSWFLFAFTGITGNMLVPTQVLPGIVQDISFLTPQYYFFTGVRVALGSETASLTSILALFGLYAIVLNILGFIALDRGVRYLKRTGTYSWS
jgi:ABC-type multidrug transport system permease subunit